MAMMQWLTLLSVTAELGARTPLSLVSKKHFLCSLFTRKKSILSICGQEVTCLTSNRQDSKLDSCFWKAVSSISSHQP